jgi:hypothetical protein
MDFGALLLCIFFISLFAYGFKEFDSAKEYCELCKQFHNERGMCEYADNE